MTIYLDRRQLIGGAAALSLLPGISGKSFGQASRSVKFLFDVLPNPKHALFYPAQEKGFFREEGLEVTIEAGKGSADVIQNVASGAAEFGFADASAVALAKTRGLSVTLVAMVHYKTLMSIITRGPSGINKPADLVGKRIASTSGDAVRTVMPAFAKLNGFDADKVNFVTVAHSAKASMLMAGQVDGVCDYLSAFPIYRSAATAEKLELRAIAYSDFGLDIYSNGIVVADDTLRSKPDLVKSFVRSIVRGLAFAASQREEAVRVFRKFQPQYDETVTREGLGIAVEHLLVPEVHATGLGSMSAEKMGRTIRTTVEAYGLPKEPPASDIYTNAMLPHIFPQKS